MQVEFKKHEHFIMALTYEEGEAGQVKDGALHYVPKKVFEIINTVEELAENSEALNSIGLLRVEGNSINDLQEVMEKWESFFVSAIERLGVEKMEKAIQLARKTASGGVHSGSCY